MTRRLLPIALTLTLLSPFAAAQTAPASPAAPADPSAAAPAPKKRDHVGGKISAVDAAAKTVTLTHKKKTVVLSVPDTAKIYKPGDAKGAPTGAFTDLTVDTMISAATDGSADAPTAKTVHIRAPKTTGQ